MPLVAIIGPALLMLSGIGIAAPTAPDSVRAERPATAEVRPRASALLPIDRPRPRPEALLAPTQPRRTTMMLGAMLSRSERDLVALAPQRKLPRAHRAALRLALHAHTRPELLAPRTGKPPLLPLMPAQSP